MLPALISLAVLRLARRHWPIAREMLGQDGREGRRHVLGDQHRRTSITPPILAMQRGQRLRAAGRGADHQHARQHRRRTAAMSATGCCGTSGRRLADFRQRDVLARRWPAAVRRGALARAGQARGSSRSARGGSEDVGSIATWSAASGCSRRRRATARCKLISAFRRVSVDAMITTRSRFFSSSSGSAADAVELRHVDVEHDDIGIDALELIDAPRGRCAAWRRPADRARLRPSARIARARPRRRRRPSRGYGGATAAASDASLRSEVSSRSAAAIAAARRVRSARLPGTWPRRSPCRRAS